MPRNLLSDGMKRGGGGGFRRGSGGSQRGGEDDQSSASESRNMLTVPVDDHDNSTDCEEFYDDDGDGLQQSKSHNPFSDNDNERNDEYLTEVDDSSDDENISASQSSKVPRRNAKELSLYIQRVLGRPLRAVTCFKECEHGGTVIQTEHADDDETSDDESSYGNEAKTGQANDRQSFPASQVSDIETSDIEDDDLGIDLDHDDHRNNSNSKERNTIDSYLQGHFARLSTTDHDHRGRSDSEVDEGHLPPGIVVSNWGGPSADVSHPVTEEEILSEREFATKPNTIRTKRSGRTRGQFSKQSNYLTASLPTLGQSETDSESESDGRQLIRSSIYQTSGSNNFRNFPDKSSSETQETLSNLPSTDSESFEFEDEDDSLQMKLKHLPSKSCPVSDNDSNTVKVVSQLSINDN